MMFGFYGQFVLVITWVIWENSLEFFISVAFSIFFFRMHKCVLPWWILGVLLIWKYIWKHAILYMIHRKSRHLPTNCSVAVTSKFFRIFQVCAHQQFASWLKVEKGVVVLTFNGNISVCISVCLSSRVLHFSAIELCLLFHQCPTILIQPDVLLQNRKAKWPSIKKVGKNWDFGPLSRWSGLNNSILL